MIICFLVLLGCVSRIEVGGVPLEFGSDSLQLSGIENCPVCARDTCLNGGQCRPATRVTGYQCVCPEGFSGLNCELIGERCFAGNLILGFIVPVW